MLSERESAYDEFLWRYTRVLDLWEHRDYTDPVHGTVRNHFQDIAFSLSERLPYYAQTWLLPVPQQDWIGTIRLILNRIDTIFNADRVFHHLRKLEAIGRSVAPKVTEDEME